ITAAVLEDDGPQHRTVPVPIGDAGLPVRAGDRVDVWATGDPSTSTDGRAATHRVASGARVAAASDRSVVLEVTPGQVEAVAAAAATATITLAGR
ncbi:MAG: Flp pilus assembly protein RcpC/CpaB, partial [Ilumatobacteraceae bacterium]|nr:Flp pilus assembly protein RcpC/CpaB [Ilumatobacteraceae bacterium]